MTWVQKPDHIKDRKSKKLFGGGYRKPVKDDMGLLWCNCIHPRLTSPVGRGQAYCLKCKTPWYH